MTNEATRVAFDYEHGCFPTENRSEAKATWLFLRLNAPTRVEFEDSGDGYRIFVPSLGAYFWPEDASEAAWAEEAARLVG